MYHWKKLYLRAATKKAAIKTRMEGKILNPKLAAVVVAGSVVGACVAFDTGTALDTGVGTELALAATTDDEALQ